VQSSSFGDSTAVQGSGVVDVGAANVFDTSLTDLRVSAPAGFTAPSIEDVLEALKDHDKFINWETISILVREPVCQYNPSHTY
jgi:hypothetical protein